MHLQDLIGLWAKKNPPHRGKTSLKKEIKSRKDYFFAVVSIFIVFEVSAIAFAAAVSAFAAIAFTVSADLVAEVAAVSGALLQATNTVPTARIVNSFFIAIVF